MKRILYISLFGVFLIGGCSFTGAEKAAEQAQLPADEKVIYLPPQNEQPVPLAANDQATAKTTDANTVLQQPAEPVLPAPTAEQKSLVIPETLNDLATPAPQTERAADDAKQQAVDINEVFSQRNAAIAAKIEDLKTRIASFVKGLSDKELQVYQKYVASSQGDVAQWEQNRKELYEVLSAANAKIFDDLKAEYARLQAEQAELLKEIKAHSQRVAGKSDSN